ncbi:spermidine/putrescine transport system permease protein [Tistlia consotensis]|uniref:Spermidine/putrescine transport system permease protein n=1 Tax=Tistlia consotensis USBA 355 TaxID=560819 RepID=A0A1Y6BPC3_9PROT|nr:ABC transporter permease [Tistlia consotensis]SMF13204.1 spermidine/putrescine transport system permease protein [Tistlia consotensis USBA 355]SNR50669.1 spermidine/putrescine transport system permease protein [Tistlia consotensis]
MSPNGIRVAFSRFFHRWGPGVGIFVTGSVALWIVLLIVLPQLAMFDASFRFNLPPAEIGGPRDLHTLSNYAALLLDGRGGINWLDLGVLGRTILAAVFVTILDLLLCYPIAFVLAHGTSGGRARLMVLGLIVPFWVNEILRAFAFRIIFGSSGVLNAVGLGLGLWAAPVDFIRQDVALYAGLTYTYLLLMIFPIYNAVEALDRNQIEAARDLGSPWWRVHWRIVIPVAKPGIASGATMVFMLTAGALAAPQILGGPSSLWFTQLIYQWFNEGGNWPRGSAYAVVLLLACILVTLLAMRVFKVRIGEIGR